MQGMQGGAPKFRPSLSGSMKTSVIVVVLGRATDSLTIMEWTARTVLKHATIAVAFSLPGSRS